MLFDFFLWTCVKDNIYETPMNSLHELKLTIFAANERVTPEMLESTWREIEHRLVILHAKKVRMLKLFSVLQY
jgi:hypothetical protein